MAALTSRYARAFTDVVFDLGLEPASVLRELQVVIEILNSSAPLRRVWENPAIAGVQKRKVLDAIVARENLSKPVRNFAAVLIDHRRIEQLEEITRQVENELNQRMGLAQADIISARELADDEKNALERRIETLTGKRVRARFVTDRGILGGAIVRLGSTIYDGSVRGQLQRMKEQLVAE